MALNLLNGQMLNSTLARDGVNLSIANTANSTSLVYFDVANNRVGINTTAANIANATSALTITGNGTANNFSVSNNLTAVGNIYSGNIIVSGLVQTANFIATNNANAVNISASGNINAFANVIGGNINTSNNVNAGNTVITANLSVTGTANINNLFATNFSAAGNSTGTNLSLSGNVTANNVIVLTDITAVGNIVGNVLSAVSNISAPNIYASTVAVLPSITGLTDGNVTINHNGTGVINLDNIAITNTTVTSTVTTPVIIAGTTGLGLPYGDNSERPVTTPPTGTTRFNTILNNLETWDGAAWAPAGLMAGAPGTIANQQILDADGSQTTWTLNQSSQTNEVLVNINGVLQRPGASGAGSYSVVDNIITFGEAPDVGDIIDIRFISYSATVSSLVNSTATAFVTVTPASAVQFGTSSNVAATINAAGLLSITSQGIKLPTYSVANVGNVSTPQAGQVIYVTNGNAGDPCLAVYDGSTWKRVALGATISAT